MQRFTLTPAGVAAISRRILLIAVPIMALALGVGIYVGLAGSGPGTGGRGGSAPALLSGGVMVVIGGAVIAMVIKQQRRLWESFELTVGEMGLTKRQSGFADLSISRGEVRRIREAPGGLVVETGSALRQLGIPSGIERYDELKQLLGAWQPIETIGAAQSRRGLILGAGAALATLLAFGAVFLSQNPLIVVPLGSLLALGLAASVIITHRSAMFDTRTRRLMWVVVFPMASIIGKIVFMLRQ